jgi:hypothetical protein
VDELSNPYMPKSLRSNLPSNYAKLRDAIQYTLRLKRLFFTKHNALPNKELIKYYKPACQQLAKTSLKQRWPSA